MAITIQGFSNSNYNWYLQPKQENLKRKSGSHTGKKLADVTATVLWLTAIGFAAYKTGLFNKKSPEYIYNKAKQIQKKYAKLENISNLDNNVDLNKLLKNEGRLKRFTIKTLYNLGQKFENTKAKMGDELYNNMLNSLGKLFIMPLVICASPFGNKETSKKEKISLIIREPLSVVATFTLQGAFDKIFDVYMPKILESNMFESSEIKSQYEKFGKVMPAQFENLRYNPKEAKRLFVELTGIDVNKGGLKDVITRETAENLVTLKPFESENYQSYINHFEKAVEDGRICPEKLQAVKNKFKIVADCVGNYELAKIKPKIAMNIVTVVILSRIFLNVIHGKAVRLLNLNENKEGKNA